MKRILFVDDEPAELARYRDMFAGMTPGWELGCAAGGKEALRMMFQEPYDVVVADYAMPEMDGLALLNLVMQRYPKTVRLIVWTSEEKEAGIKQAGLAHQDVCKPVNQNELASAIERTMALRELLSNDKLKGLVAQIQSLPSMPDLYLRLLDELNEKAPAIDRVGDVIRRDPAMCAKLLHLVNSAFYGLPKKITNPGEAALHVGVDTIKTLVLSLQFFALFERVRIPEFSFDGMWSHSWNTGLIAKRIAQLERLNFHEVDQAFTAGLLHDAGKLVLATGLPNQYQSVLRQQRFQPAPVWEVEKELLGASHADVGAYLLALWALPDPLVETVAWHHRPTESFRQGLTPLLIVHVANLLEQEGRTPTDCLPVLDSKHIGISGLSQRLDEWRKTARTVLSGDPKE